MEEEPQREVLLKTVCIGLQTLTILFYDINWDNDTVLGKNLRSLIFNGVISGSTGESVPEIRSHGSYIFNPSTKGSDCSNNCRRLR